MFNDQYWAHSSPNGTEPWDFIVSSGYVYKVAGENLARDFSNTAEMIEAWMASPTHRANIMNDNYTEIGIAVVDGTLEGFETTLVVQMFGKPRQVQASIPETSNDSPKIHFADDEPEQQIAIENQPQRQQEVLASIVFPQGSIEAPPLFTPLQLTKAFFLAVIMMIMITLIYDALVIGNKQTVRLVGKNFAHIIFLFTLAFLVIFFKGGFIDEGIFINN
jgi:Cysteine-rich secretory protein family